MGPPRNAKRKLLATAFGGKQPKKATIKGEANSQDSSKTTFLRIGEKQSLRKEVLSQVCAGLTGPESGEGLPANFRVVTWRDDRGGRRYPGARQIHDSLGEG